MVTDPESGAELSRDNLVIGWEAPEDAEIDAYVVHLLPVDPILLDVEYTLEVPATVHDVRVPPELLQPGQAYQFELTAVGKNGNGSSSQGEFSIEDNAIDLDPASFTAVVDNPYLPLPVGATWTYEVLTPDGEIDRREVQVLAETATVAGIEATAVQEALFVDDQMEERTVSWYAQDTDGNVWLLGEIDEGYEDGELVETSTWEPGVDFARPGIVVPAEAFGDDEFVVNFLIGADGAVGERGRVDHRAATVDVVAGAFEQVLIVELRADIPPGQVDRKYYAPGVGLVFEDSDVGETDVAQLVDFAVTN